MLRWGRFIPRYELSRILSFGLAITAALPCRIPKLCSLVLGHLTDCQHLQSVVRRTILTPQHQATSIAYLLIHESPLTDTLFLLVSKSDEVTTT